MDKDQLVYWLICRIDAMQREVRLSNFNNDIQTINDSHEYLQLYKGIEVIADVLGLELTCDSFGGYDHKRVYYNGFPIVQVDRIEDSHAK